jgi:DNA-binding transcriptional LysR family regulator
MELRQLRHFQEIVRCSSFGQAADKLNITQPALSKSIRNLERSLGCQLLERHPSGVTPTEYGLVFLDYAALVTSELERAVEELNALRGRGRGVVRVGAGTTMMRYLLPQAVRRFMAQAEGNSVSFRQGLKDELMAALRRGDIDIMVGSTDPDQLPEDMRHEPVLQDRIVVVADKGHPLAGRKPITLADLGHYQWVLPEASEPEGERLARAFRRAGLEPQRVAVRTGSSVFMAALLKDSAYLSYLPAALIALDVDYAHLTPIDLTEPIWPPVLVGITYRRRGVMLAPVRRFINRLKEVAREVPKG